MTLDKKGKGTRPLGALRNMPVVDADLRRRVKQRQRPSTAKSMKDYLENEEDKQRRVDEMQERVNEAVKDYMSNLIQTRALLPAAPQQQVVVAQPITVPVPVVAPNHPLETFVSAGLELLEQEMPRPPTRPPTPAQSLRPASPAKSFIRAATPARPVSAVKISKELEPEPLPTQAAHQPTPALSVRPPSPAKSVVRAAAPVKCTKEPEPEPITIPVAPVEENVETAPVMPRPPSPVRSVRPATARPASSAKGRDEVKGIEEDTAAANENQAVKQAGDIRRPDEKFDRHWLTWPRTPGPQSERSKTPGSVFGRPKNPTKLRRSKTSFDRPVFTPVPNEFVELDPRPPSGEQPTLNFVPGEPREYGRSVPYVPAFQSWMKSASNEEKDVVYKMMKSLKAQQVNSAPHTRYVSYTEADRTKRQPSTYGIRTSMPAVRPTEMYQLPEGQHLHPCNSCEDYLIKTWANQVGREEAKPFAAPTYYRNVEYRPVAKHQTRIPMHRDYHHENSHFQDTQRPFRSHYIIFPDWVSENSHFKKQRQLNGHRYH